jgi:hypothetical protein
MPELRVEFTPPTTEAQLGWEIDASCAVEVSVPTAFEGDGGTCTRVDVAVGNDAADHNPCPHLRLEATAHTDAAGCSLKVNGVDLLSSCGADRTAAYLNGGVCAAVVDSAAAPRAACFDTKTAGKGADQLAAWAERLPAGSPVMIASCSRLAWAHNRDNLVAALNGTLGAMQATGSGLSSSSDAYAVVAVRGGSAPLAEARLPCCLSPPCTTCAQGITRAVSDVACGVAATRLDDTLTVAFKRAERAAERATLRAKSLADPYTASKSGPFVSQDTCACADPLPCAHDAIAMTSAFPRRGAPPAAPPAPASPA